MDVVVNDLQKKIPLNLPALKRIIIKILKQQKVKNVNLAVLFVTSQKITAMNRQFLGRNNATDVLAFDSTDSEVSYQPSKKKVVEIDGDIIISTGAVIKNSKEFKTTLQHELSLYVIHGILHLLGFDDHSPKDIAKMRTKEAELVNFVLKDIDKVISEK